MPARLLDFGCPLNWDHPLNRVRLLGWWLCLPDQQHGVIWRNVVGLSGRPGHDATLTGMDPTSDWLGARGRPGGWGCLDFRAVGYVSVPAALLASLAGTTAATVTCWFRTSAFSSYESLFDATSGGGGSTRQLSLFINATNHAYVGFANTVGNDISSVNPQWTLNEWQQLALVTSGTSVLVYRNGRLAGTVGGAAVGSGFLAAEWQIGGNPSTGGTLFSGQQDDVRVYGRSLPAAEIHELYQQSRRGYPDLLRWRRRISYSVPEAAGADTTISLDPVASQWTVVSPTVSVGATLALAPVASAWSVQSPTVTTGTTFTVGPVASSWAVVSPSVTTGSTLTLAPLASTWSVVAPTISVGTTLALETLASVWTIVGPEVRAGTELSLDPLISHWALVAPAVQSAGGITLAPLVSTWTVVDPAVTVGATLTLGPLASTWAVVAPTVQAGTEVSLSPLTSQWSIVAPEIGSTLTVEIGPLASQWTIVAPAVSVGTTLALSSLASAWTVQSPTVQTGTEVTLAPVASQWTVVAPVLGGLQGLPPPPSWVGLFPDQPPVERRRLRPWERDRDSGQGRRQKGRGRLFSLPEGSARVSTPSGQRIHGQGRFAPLPGGRVRWGRGNALRAELRRQLEDLWLLTGTFPGGGGNG